MKTFFCVGVSAMLSKDVLPGSLADDVYQEEVLAVQSYCKCEKSDLLEIAQEDYEHYSPLSTNEKFTTREDAVKSMVSDPSKDHFNNEKTVFVLLEVDVGSNSVIGVEEYRWDQNTNSFAVVSV